MGRSPLSAQHFTHCASSPENITVVLPADLRSAVGTAGNSVAPGDEIAFVTRAGACVGQGTWTESGTQIAAAGAIQSGDVGYKPGDTLRVVVWDASEQAEYAVESMAFGSCSPGIPCSSDGRYVPDGFVNVSKLQAPTLLAQIEQFNITERNGQVTLHWRTRGASTLERIDIEYRTGDVQEEWMHWASIKEGLSSNEDVRYPAGLLRVGSHQFRLKLVYERGQSRYSLVQTVQIASSASFVVTDPYPNPFHQCGQFEVAVPAAQSLRIDVYNTLGQHVRKLHRGTVSAKQMHTFRMCNDQLASGVYFIRVEGETFATTRRVTLVR